MRLLTSLFLPLAILALVHADEPVSEQLVSNAPATTSVLVQDSRVTRQAALNAFREAREDDGIAKLAALSPSDAQTAPWYFDLVMNLLRTASAARAAGDEIAAGKAARRAWKTIEKAEAGYVGQPARLSTLQDIRAVLLEDFLGTSEQAEACYREAARLNPENLATKERVEHLDRKRAEATGSAQTATPSSASKP